MNSGSGHMTAVLSGVTLLQAERLPASPCINSCAPSLCSGLIPDLGIIGGFCTLRLKQLSLIIGGDVLLGQMDLESDTGQQRLQP